VRSPKRILAASVLSCQALVLFFAGLVAKDLSSLGTGTAVGVAAGMAAACLLAAGLLRSAVGYVLGSVLQLASVLTGLWVPAMFFLGAVFAGLWVWALLAGSRIERRRAALQRQGG
jgi:hypothetical protein